MADRYLYLDEVRKKDNMTTLVYISMLREDFVEKIFKITVQNGLIIQLYFSSNSFGTAYWINERGLTDAHQWENEGEAQDVSFLSRHYTSLLQDGLIDNYHDINRIVDDVLSAFPHPEWREFMSDMVEKNRPNPECDVEKMIADTNDFSNDLDKPGDEEHKKNF